MAKKQKIVKAKPIKPLKTLEDQYKRDLMKLGRALSNAIRTELLPMLKAEQSSYVSDGLATNLEAVFSSLNKQFNGTAVLSFARQTSEIMVNEVAKQNKKRFDKSMENAIGVDIGKVISGEGLEDFIQLNISSNTSLITNISEEYLKNIQTIVTNGVSSGARYSTIEKQITAKLGSADSKLLKRIKTIARNEVSTINSQLTLKRSEQLGITRGIYRTSHDERVRLCHKELDGVEYDLSKGAWSKTCNKFIQPGITDIMCRCTYSPIINID